MFSIGRCFSDSEVLPFTSVLFELLTLEALLRPDTSDAKLETNGDGGSVE